MPKRGISLVHWFKMNRAGSSMNCRKISLTEVLQGVVPAISRAAISEVRPMRTNGCSVQRGVGILLPEQAIFKSLSRLSHLMLRLSLQIKPKNMCLRQILHQAIHPDY